MTAYMLSPASCPGLSRLRGRSPFGAAKARASTSSFFPAMTRPELQVFA